MTEAVNLAEQTKLHWEGRDLKVCINSNSRQTLQSPEGKIVCCCDLPLSIKTKPGGHNRASWTKVLQGGWVSEYTLWSHHTTKT